MLHRGREQHPAARAAQTHEGTRPARQAQLQAEGAAAGQHLLDVAGPVVHRDELLLNHVELLQAVGVLGVCDIPDVLEYLGRVDQLAPIDVRCCRWCRL